MLLSAHSHNVIAPIMDNESDETKLLQPISKKKKHKKKNKENLDSEQDVSQLGSYDTTNTSNHALIQSDQTQANVPTGLLKHLDTTLSNLDNTLNRLYEEKRENEVKKTINVTKVLDKIDVFVRVVFLKIGEIDTVKENFEATVFIQASWKEPQLDGFSQAEFDKCAMTDYWNPQLTMENSVGQCKQTVWYTMTHSSKGEAYVEEKRRVEGKFLEYMELKSFPFDTQDLTISVSTDLSEKEVCLMQDSQEMSSLNIQAFVDAQEWTLHKTLDIKTCVAVPLYKNTKFRRPVFSVSATASRQAGFFMWNIFLVMFLICSLTFATFTINTGKPENRLQLSFTLLLTTVTFKLNASQSLPRISYRTYLDKYIFTCMLMLVTICVWHSILPLLPTENESFKDTADNIALAILATIYLFFQIFFFAKIAYKKRKLSKSKQIKEQQQKEQVAILESDQSKPIPPPDSFNNKSV